MVVTLGCEILHRALGRTFSGWEPPDIPEAAVGLWDSNEKFTGHVSKWYMDEDPRDITTSPADKLKKMPVPKAYEFLEELHYRGELLDALPRRVKQFLNLDGDEADTVIAKLVSSRYGEAHDMKRGWKSWQKAIVHDLTPAEITDFYMDIKQVKNPFVQPEVKKVEVNNLDEAIAELFG